MTHLDELRLDAVRAGQGTSEEAAHVQACGDCLRTIERWRALAGALKRLPGPIPAEIDRAVLQPPRKIPSLRPWLTAAAAASLLAAFGVLALQDAPSQSTTILDAYRLARQIQAGAADPSSDVTRDGRVDQADVDRLAMLSVLLLGMVDAPAPRGTEFFAVDVFVDAGKAPLAAYQIEVTAPQARIVGLEGGDAEAFADAPYYDPAALRAGRIIFAAYTTDAAPQGKIRVARVHLQGTGPIETKLVASAPNAVLEVVGGNR